jgi:hypothetical protein
MMAKGWRCDYPDCKAFDDGDPAPKQKVICGDPTGQGLNFEGNIHNWPDPTRPEKILFNPHFCPEHLWMVALSILEKAIADQQRPADK